ncbi:MAG: glycosyltransferase family 2 protein [Burkholderiales bacterium]
MKSPVLFLVFNRPDTTRQVFEAIRAAKPPRLYIAADGPRASRDGDAERCKQVRSIATNVDWPCEVKTLFRDKNLGCKIGVSDGINWFFENEEEGVIIEDDILPLPSFFDYCDELLARYRHDEKVAMISGCNLVSTLYTPANSYFFSLYNHIWGWASWRRSWKQYDVAMKTWPQWRDHGGLQKLSSGNRLFENYWRNIFNNVHVGNIDTWDYQWTFACWKSNGLAVLPAQNLTHNLGFGPDATHTTSGTPKYVAKSVPRPLEFPLIHPNVCKQQTDADARIEKEVLGITHIADMKRILKTIPYINSGLRNMKALLKNGR